MELRGVTRRWRLGLVAVALLGIVSGWLTLPMASASTVNATILAGPLTVGVTGPSVITVTDQPETQVITIQLTLAVSDLRSTRAGWQVSLAAAQLRCTCGATLPATALSIATIADPEHTVGQVADANGGPSARPAAEGATLETSPVVQMAQPGYGDGAYVQDVTIHLLVPAHTPAGHYVTAWTLTTAMPV